MRCLVLATTSHCARFLIERIVGPLDDLCRSTWSIDLQTCSVCFESYQSRPQRYLATQNHHQTAITLQHCLTIGSGPQLAD